MDYKTLSLVGTVLSLLGAGVGFFQAIYQKEEIKNDILEDLVKSGQLEALVKGMNDG